MESCRMIDKKKAVEIIKDAPAGWGYYSELRNRFFIENRDNNFSDWYRSDAGKWKECIPLHETIESMIPKSEILKIAEGEEMKYPYIGQWKEPELTVLFVANCEGFEVENAQNYKRDWSEREYTNITREYLANTYGEVQSPEHAEFIIELAELHGLKVWFPSDGLKRITHFACAHGEISMHSHNCEGIVRAANLKQITIPLPPKQIQTTTPEEEFEMEQIMKNAGDNLVLGCEDSKCDEWPQVGDEVLICNIKPDSRVIDFNNEKVKVIAKTKDERGTVLTVSNPFQGIGAIMFISKHVKKPKTPEEELRDEIVQTIHDDVYGGVYEKQYLEVFANVLMSKYNITKKPQ